MTEAVKPKEADISEQLQEVRNFLQKHAGQPGKKTAVLHLTEEQWVELLACVDSKKARVAQGEYDDDDTLYDDGFDPKRWEDDLKDLSLSLQEQGESQGISF